MAMPNFLNLLKVRTPSYNIFQYPIVHNKLDMQIGRNIPVKYVELFAGEEVDIKLSQLTRFMPMMNPIFHQVDIEFIPFFVPYRLLEEFGFPARDFFNDATPDSERPAMPMITLSKLYSSADTIIGSIWDYLRYPTYSHLLRELQNLQTTHFVVGPHDEDAEGTFNYSNLVAVFPNEGSPCGYIIQSDVYDLVANVFDFSTYVARSILRAGGMSEEDINTYFSLDSVHSSTLTQVFYDQAYQALGKRVDELMNNYLSYLHQSLFNAYASGKTLTSVSLLPWLCYCRLIYDWFINTNITDISNVPDIFKALLAYIADGDSFRASLHSAGLTTGDLSFFFPYVDDQFVYHTIISRTLWHRDYFTGSFPNSQAGDAVPIPANGTIPDLANARKLQKYRTRTLFGGKRFIDQIFAHRGVKSSDARLDRCEVIGEKKSYRLQISDVLQTSQSTIDSVQGDFAGHGISYSSDHLAHYRAEEPGLVMVIGRVRPKNSYIDAVPRLIFKSDFYDFENPDFDNVGMQPIMYDELQVGTPSTGDRVFSWTRRYQEYMTDFDEYHGHFQTSLSNWHMARMFVNGHPAFNTQFSVIRSDGADNLNRIFANPGYRFNVLCDLAFDIQVSRPLSKVIEFDY